MMKQSWLTKSSSGGQVGMFLPSSDGKRAESAVMLRKNSIQVCHLELLGIGLQSFPSLGHLPSSACCTGFLSIRLAEIPL